MSLRDTKREKELLETIGARIRELREAEGMSILDLAFKSGMDSGHISRIERGERNTGVVTLDRVLDGLDLTLKDFFGSLDL